MISLEIKHDGERHRNIIRGLRERLRAADRVQQERHKRWKQSEELMSGYVPESEVDALRRAKKEGGAPQYVTIQLPYTYAVLMAAHSYWSTVFLSRTPVFQFEGLTGEGEDQVLALEALIKYQTLKGRMLAPLYIWLNDVGKYGEAWVSPYWRIDRQRTSQIIEVEDKYLGLLPTGKKKKVQQITTVVGYAGNSLYNIQPSDVFTDPRYARSEFQKGEFVAIKTKLSYNQLLEGSREERYINVDRIKQQGRADIPFGDDSSQNAEGMGMQRPDLDAFSTGYTEKASDVIRAYEFIVNIIPRDWKLGKSDLPQKWVFTVTADFRVVLECRPLGDLHDMYPLAFIETEPEAYSQFNRSLRDTFQPLQDTMDWLVNSHFFNVRQVLNNQWLLDPSRIETRDLENGKPGKAIRLKPAAYGTDIRQALMQLPVADVTQSHLGDMQFLHQMGERMGISDTIMGMGHPSSRRTAQEVRGSQTFQVSRLKTIAEYFSATGFTDLSRMITMNSQQYYDGNMKLKIAGDAAALAGEKFINVTPEMIVGDYMWAAVDGTLPVDRFAQANLWREMIMQMSKVPQVMMQYDLGKIFSYVAQLAGLKNIDRFKVQVVPDAMMMQQAQAGNSVPAAGGNTNEPGQIPLMGPTA